MLKLLAKVGLLAVVFFVAYPLDGSAEILSVDHPKLIEIRKHIMMAYSKRPKAVDQCSEKEHRAAVKLYTRIVSPDEQNAMLKDMEYSIMNSTDDFFTGMDETIAALSSTKIKYILYWERKYINSATYRYPLTGKLITLHMEFSPAASINKQYTEPDTGRIFDLVNCYPLPKFVVKYYKNFVPVITRLQHDVAMNSPRNQFIKTSTGIGGKFTEVIKFATNPWIHDAYRRSSIRTTLLLRGYEKPSNGSNNASEESMESEVNAYFGLNGVSPPLKSGYAFSLRGLNN